MAEVVTGQDRWRRVLISWSTLAIGSTSRFGVSVRRATTSDVRLLGACQTRTRRLELSVHV